jgi:inorganic pyrophosphatase
MRLFSPLAILSCAPATASAWSTAAPRWSPRRQPTRRVVVPATVLSSYSTAAVGEVATESFRLAFTGEGESTISPWHDIPLRSSSSASGGGGYYNAVIEIPKMTKAKMEVATKEPNNPIAQDIKKGKLRDYHGPIFWNYGCLPQTWEDPNLEHSELKCFGDNDPIDVVEIGSRALAMGTVVEVKPLGVLAMIDDGELDWKVRNALVRRGCRVHVSPPFFFRAKAYVLRMSFCRSSLISPPLRLGAMIGHRHRYRRRTR